MKPVSGTKEWADGSANIQRGCEHMCHYCYSRAKDGDPSTWDKVMGQPLRDRKKRPNRIMFPTRHDITPQNLDQVVATLPKLLEQADNLLIVTKPHFGCIAQICRAILQGPVVAACDQLREIKQRVMFRFTIGSQDNEILKFWEPSAPSYEERVASLIYAHHMGFQTSVSCEPALDLPLEYPKLVETLSPWVTDAIWIGRMNHVHERLTTNQAPEDVISKGLWLEGQWNALYVKELYELLKGNPKVKWKDSIKEALGLERPTTPGSDR